MIDVDKWQEIFTSIRRHKLRTALTAFGVAWGIFMLVALLGMGQGLQNGIEHDFRDDAINSLWIRAGKTSMPYKGLKEGRNIQFDNSDYDLLRDQFPEIDEISGRFYVSGSQTVTYKDKNMSFSTRGVHPGHQTIENSVMLEGRYILDKDLDAFSKVAVIGKIVRDDLFGKEESLGKQINIGGTIYKVVGVFKDSGGDDEMRNIFIPVTTAQKVYSGGTQLHQLMVSGGNLGLREMQVLESKIHNTLARNKNFDPSDERAVRIFNLAEEFQQIMGLMGAIRGLTWLVGIFSILAGVIGISNIMLIIVKDRTKEIGIRKAIGATPGSIVNMIMQESIFITSVAGYIGLLLGIGLIYAASGVESEYFRNPQVNLGMVIIALLVLIITGTLAGLIPAIQAARINPVEAIKSD